MNVIRARDYEEMSRQAANLIAAQVVLKKNSVLGLATGSTPVGIYKVLAGYYHAGDLDFSACGAVNLDEYAGLGPEHPQSYARFMREQLFSRINLPEEKRSIPCGTAEDALVECARYDRVIEEQGGIDLQLLGIGHNGHIGFNEPSGCFEKGTHYVALTESTIKANARFFGPEERVPTHAFTMGIKSILSARHILLVASGAEKAEILKQALFGEITPRVPASVLQLHGNVTVVADEAAMRLIEA